MKDMYQQTQEVQQIPNRINSETHTETLYANYQTKRILKAVREKQLVTYEGPSIGITANFPSETMEAGRCEVTYLKCWKKKLINQKFYTWQNCPSKIGEKLRHFQINKN